MACGILVGLALGERAELLRLPSGIVLFCKMFIALAPSLILIPVARVLMT